MYGLRAVLLHSPCCWGCQAAEGDSGAKVEHDAFVCVFAVVLSCLRRHNMSLVYLIRPEWILEMGRERNKGLQARDQVQA